jgi:hypothetical protein
MQESLHMAGQEAKETAQTADLFHNNPFLRELIHSKGSTPMSWPPLTSPPLKVPPSLNTATLGNTLTAYELLGGHIQNTSKL